MLFSKFTSSRSIYGYETAFFFFNFLTAANTFPGVNLLCKVYVLFFEQEKAYFHVQFTEEHKKDIYCLRLKLNFLLLNKQK